MSLLTFPPPQRFRETCRRKGRKKMKEQEKMKNTDERRPSKQNKINTFKNYKRLEQPAYGLSSSALGRGL